MKENKYKKALNALISSDIKLHVYKNQDEVDEENQPSIFDFYHHELIVLNELINEYEKQCQAIDNACVLLEKNVTRSEYCADPFGSYDIEVPVRTKDEWKKFLVLNWEVYSFDRHKRKIKKYNIFDHLSFYESLKSLLKKAKCRDDLLESVQTELKYYFWSKYEWELVVKDVKGRIKLSPLCADNSCEIASIDVTTDTSFNWQQFAKEHIEKQIFDNEAKIDVFDQVYFKYDEFIDYIWEMRELFK